MNNQKSIDILALLIVIGVSVVISGLVMFQPKGRFWLKFGEFVKEEKLK